VPEYPRDRGDAGGGTTASDPDAHDHPVTPTVTQPANPLAPAGGQHAQTPGGGS
jgi:hypothetical protein